MKPGLLLATGLLIPAIYAPVADAAASNDFCADHPTLAQCVKAVGIDDRFSVGSAGDANDGARSSGDAESGPASLSITYLTFDYAPACTGNTRTDDGNSCQAAYEACKNAGNGFLNYWRWRATVVRATGEVQDPPGWTRDAGDYCRGPQAPGIDPIAAIAGIVAADFEDLVVLKGEAISEPDGQTLVNYDTGFYTRAGRYTLAPRTILGHRVVVTANPTRYDWHFGDGAVLEDGGPGRRGTLDVAHVYDEARRVAPYVVITWSGTYTVDGGAPRPVLGTATTTGPGTPLQVRQARSELVQG